MRHGRKTEIGLAVLVLVGASVFASARMGVTTTRTIPYQGTLEHNGAAANGDYLMRFGLFVASPTANDLVCVVNDNCALWSEEQLVTVTNGRFSVLLGDSDGDLTDQILANNTLFVGMAVKPAADASPFVTLDGAQEIVPVPWAARPSVASAMVVTNSFRVLNGLTTQFDSPALFTNQVTVGSPAGAHTTIDTGSITSDTIATNDLTASTVTTNSVAAASGTFSSMRIGANAGATAGTVFREVRMGTSGTCNDGAMSQNTGTVNFGMPQPGTLPLVFVSGNRGNAGNAACLGAYVERVRTTDFDWRLVPDVGQGAPQCDCVQWIALFP